MLLTLQHPCDVCYLSPVCKFFQLNSKSHDHLASFGQPGRVEVCSLTEAQTPYGSEVFSIGMGRFDVQPMYRWE